MTEHSMKLSALAEALKDGGHSIFSPSGSPLWMLCSGGLIPNLLQPDNSGIDAAEGTVAHYCGELWLVTDKRPNHLVGTTRTVKNGGVKYQIEITDSMLDYVEVYVHWCDWLVGDHFVEQKVYFDPITPIPRQGGTADHVACSWQRMVITDFKYGKGVRVFAEGNTQALLYALGFFFEWDWLYDFQEIVIRICQPRLGVMDTWTITREFLLEWAEYAKERAHAAWRFDAPRTAGAKQCLFCKVSTDCAANLQYQEDLVTLAFEDIGVPITEDRALELKQRLDDGIYAEHYDVMKLTIGQMSFIYKHRGAVERWWKSLHNELTRRAAKGIAVPGMKLVESRSHRKFTDMDKTAFALEEYGVERKEIITESIESPASVERILRRHGVKPRDLKTVLAPLVKRPPGKATLVPMSDNRPEIEDVTDVAFDDIDNSTSETEEL